MTTNQQRETATIVQFPVGGRAGLARRDEFTRAASPRVADVACGGSWYHEEAVREAELVRKN